MLHLWVRVILRAKFTLFRHKLLSIMLNCGEKSKEFLIMSSSTSRSLVPMANRELSIKPASHVTTTSSLNENNHQFTSREDVKKYLPDILGKVLAQIWIDPDFRRDFSSNPAKTLAKNGVILPENTEIEFQREDSQRPRIVVFERRPGSKFKLRIFYLQLVMMAGR
jgi:hypothetical protein